MEKTIVFGEGFLGKRISKELGFMNTKTNPLEIRLLREFLENEKPDCVINCIGKTGRPNIDWCEKNKEETMLSNVVAATNLCIECSKRGIYFVHIGSGCIYDGGYEGNGFSEKDEPNFYGPQYYAKTKILSEKILNEFPSLILRIRMPIDDRPNERNLIDKLVKYPTVIDIQNSMTTVPEMIQSLRGLIDKKETGIYNVVNDGTISAYEILEIYKRIVDPNHKFDIMSKKTLDSVTVGMRSNCKLDTIKINKIGLGLGEINECVEKCLIKYKRCI